MVGRSKNDTWGRVAFFAAAATVTAAPFETLQPMIELPGQSLSNLEAILALAVGLWAFSLARRRRAPRLDGPLTIPVLALLGALLLSGLAAAQYQREAFLFTARQAAGALTLLMIADAVDSRRRLRRALICAVASASAVGVLGVLEFLEYPPVLEALAVFRLDLSLAGIQPRVSSTLQYPTIASMYLEIAFGFALGLLTAARRKVSVAAMLASGVLIGAGVILTLTRSGLIVLAASWGLTAWIARREPGPSRLPRLGLLAASLLLVLGAVLTGREDYWLRLTTPDQREWYRAEYETPELIRLRTGELKIIPVVVKNVGRASWKPGGQTPFRLSYHWLDSRGAQVVDYEGLRTELPRTVGPGEQVALRARVRAPEQPGRYVLAWDLLSEHRFWFSRESSPSRMTQAEVAGPPIEVSPELQPIPEPRFLLSRTQLWRIAARLFWAHPLLGVGADNFRLVYGDREGLPIWDRTYHTHNTAIEFFVGAGLLGGLTFLWLSWRVATTLAQACRAASARLLPLAAGVAAAATAILCHGMVDYFLEFTPTYVMIWATCGLALAAARISESEAHADRV